MVPDSQDWLLSVPLAEELQDKPELRKGLPNQSPLSLC